MLPTLSSFLGFLFLLPFYLVEAQSTSIICATQNTGASFSSVFAQFQSRGLCGTTCSGYAFAILQGSNCWCSNYFPATEVPISDCNTGCPGFGTDNCGGTLNGAFAYYQLAQASGTQPASSAAAAATSTAAQAATSTTPRPASSTNSTPEAAPVTVVVTQTATPVPNSSTSSTSRSTNTTPAAAPTSSSTTTKTSFVTSATSGTTDTSTPSSAALQTGASESLKDNNGFFNSPGKVAGTFVAVGLVILALLAAALWFCCRRRRQQRSDSAFGAAGLNRKTSSTSTIENNSAFSDARSRTESASGLLGARGEKSVGRGSPNALNWPIENSEIVPIDQRMNPKPMLMRFDSNYSRHSLRDDEDYSRRVLTVANPES